MRWVVMQLSVGGTVGGDGIVKFGSWKDPFNLTDRTFLVERNGKCFQSAPVACGWGACIVGHHFCFLKEIQRVLSLNPSIQDIFDRVIKECFGVISDFRTLCADSPWKRFRIPPGMMAVRFGCLSKSKVDRKPSESGLATRRKASKASSPKPQKIFEKSKYSWRIFLIEKKQ